MSASTSSPIIASFDIGIKNMAYCVVELGGDGSATPSNILAWGIINMVPETASPPLCQAVVAPPKKRGVVAATPKPCTARAAFTQNGMHCCKKHADKTRIVSAKDFAALKKKTIADLRTFCTTRGISVDFGALKTQIVENIQKQLRDRFFIPVAAAAPAPNAKEMDLISAGREMTRQLDRIFCGGGGAGAAAQPLMERITHVYIENQISTIAVRMKTMQGMLTQYFIMRAPEKITIKYISALKKLKNSAAAPEAKSQKKEKTTYSERKKMGIEMCSKLLRESKSQDVVKWVTFFEGYGAKRDDLSDAFLQGVYG